MAPTAATVAPMRALGLFIALAITATSAQAQDPVQRGGSLVRKYCARCHAVGPRDASPHPAAPPFRVLNRSFDLDDFPDVLMRGISATHPDMPEVRFNEDDARAVRDYLRTIQQ